MNKIEFIDSIKQRTKELSLKVIQLNLNLPNNNTGWTIGSQVLRAATSIGANYRAACRARSKAEFFAKLSITVEEADETVYWLELLRDSNLINDDEANKLIFETQEILKILSTARKNTYK